MPLKAWPYGEIICGKCNSRRKVPGNWIEGSPVETGIRLVE